MLDRMTPRTTRLWLGLLTLLLPGLAGASSHREAPAILSTPQVDGTDFYLFRSYEPGHVIIDLSGRYLPDGRDILIEGIEIS